MSEKQIGRILKRYWSRGKTKLAVLPDFANRGGRGKERRHAARKRGRPKRFDSIYGEMNVSEEVKKIFRIALDKYYYKANRPSLRWAYEQMLKEYFSEDRKLDNGVELPVMESGTAIPSFSAIPILVSEMARPEKRNLPAGKCEKVPSTVPPRFGFHSARCVWSWIGLSDRCNGC